MSFTDLGVILTFLIGIGNIGYSINSNRKTQFINTVTSSRMKWIGELREQLTIFIELILSSNNKNQIETQTTRISYYVAGTKFNYNMNMINKSYYKLELMLNGDTDNDILNTLKEVKKYAYQYNLCCKLCEPYSLLQENILNELESDILDELFKKCNGKNEDKISYLKKEYFECGAKVVYTYIEEILNLYINKKLNDLISDLTRLSKVYLKEEWERVKLEAKLGDVNYKLEKSDGICMDDIREIKELRSWKKYKEFKKFSILEKLKCIMGYVFIALIFTLAIIILSKELYFIYKKQ